MEKHTWAFLAAALILIASGCSDHKKNLENEFGPLEKFSSPGIYSIIMIPDTQRYFRADKGPDIFRQKIEWIRDYAGMLGTVFITHIGDVIEDGKGDINHSEWKRSVKFLSILDNFSRTSKIPYSISLGDHDYNGDEKPVMGHSAFVKYFGRDRYKDFPWYGGSSNNQTSHYQYFTANGRTILHVNLECDAPRNRAFPVEEDQLAWAQKIINENPGLPVVLSTHAYITDEFKDGKFIGHEPSPEVKKKGRRTGEGRRGGLDIWKELVSRNDRIFLVLCGNYHEFNDRKGDTGEYHQVSKNRSGRDVVEILANYQGYQNGGDGWFRIIAFNEDEGTITVKTYSPFRKEFRKVYSDTPRSSDFVIKLDIKKRLKFK